MKGLQVATCVWFLILVPAIGAEEVPSSKAILKILAIDTDGDGFGDFINDAFPQDPTENRDRDGDGVGDNADAFPTDPTESRDTDGDGVGDNADAFPNDPSETRDGDGDGIGDNADVHPVGVFLDAPVQGLRYSTPTHSGVTGQAGEFTYEPGEIISFEFGSVFLGESPAKAIITPEDLLPRRPQYQNLLMSFLQTLDEDAQLNNGIRLTAFTEAMVREFALADYPTRTFPGLVEKPGYAVLAANVSNRSGWIEPSVARQNYESAIQPFLISGEYTRPDSTVEPTPTRLVDLGEGGSAGFLVTDVGDVFYANTPAEGPQAVHIEAADGSTLTILLVSDTEIRISDDVSLLALEQVGEEEVLYSWFDTSSNPQATSSKTVRLAVDGSLAKGAVLPFDNLAECIQAFSREPSMVSTREAWETCFLEYLKWSGETIGSILETGPNPKLDLWKELVGVVVAVSDENQIIEENNLDAAAGILIDLGYCATRDKTACFSAFVEGVKQNIELSELLSENFTSEYICSDPTTLIPAAIECDLVPGKLVARYTLDDNLLVNEPEEFELDSLVDVDPLFQDYAIASYFKIKSTTSGLEASIVSGNILRFSAAQKGNYLVQVTRVYTYDSALTALRTLESNVSEVNIVIGNPVPASIAFEVDSVTLNDGGSAPLPAILGIADAGTQFVIPPQDLDSLSVSSAAIAISDSTIQAFTAFPPPQTAFVNATYRGLEAVLRVEVENCGLAGDEIRVEQFYPNRGTLCSTNPGFAGGPSEWEFAVPGGEFVSCGGGVTFQVLDRSIIVRKLNDFEFAVAPFNGFRFSSLNGGVLTDVINLTPKYPAFPAVVDETTAEINFSGQFWPFGSVAEFQFVFACDAD